MYSSTPPIRPHKRPNEESSAERPRKIPGGITKSERDTNAAQTTYKFRILLPNGTTLELKMREPRKEMPIEEFVSAIRKEYVAAVKEKNIAEPETRIQWTHNDLHFTDAHGNKIKLTLNLKAFVPPEQWHFLKLQDGSPEPESYDDMWDLTPDPDLLKELPAEYTFETALADLIDNSLQAVWNNRPGEKRLVSVKLDEDSISIFDSGPGMDGRNGNIVKWGKMGASLHRSSREKAVGCKPPYLMPCFGMFGYGGPVATMHLGRRAVLSSKTKNCNSVYTLHLEKDALINSSHPEKLWRTRGSVREPSKAEKKRSPHGSFTKVQIFGLKMRRLDVNLLRFTLKDIYFPYIQCDDMSGKTSTPVEFQVNGIDLAETEGGEVATTNLHSCNGREFILQLHFTFNQDNSSREDQRNNVVLDANARLKCVYFPIIRGEESIIKIINKLEKDGYGIRESYETFSRVSIRRLGRLLPDARWAWLPFMEPKLRKGEAAQILRRCCYRVKCFIDTDAGFNPTPSKTELAHHHPYTSALKNFGNFTPEDKKEVQIEIQRDDGKNLSSQQLEKQYYDWIMDMHKQYDDEIDSGVGEYTLVVPSTKDKKLGINADVVRFYEEIDRKGNLWKAGQKIKILRGACTGVHKQNVFAILEYILLQGLEGDTCGEARLICRPLGVPEKRGCSFSTDKIDLGDSISVPVGVIDAAKCVVVDDMEWKKQLVLYEQKLPSSIDILSNKDCQQLDIEGGSLTDEVEAGDVPPEHIVAVIRPNAFHSSKNSKTLHPKFIVRENLEMVLEVNRISDAKATGKNAERIDHIYTVRMNPATLKEFHGLYIFPLWLKLPTFEKAGRYIFKFSLVNLDISCEQVVRVKALIDHCSWRVSSDKNSELKVRVGSPFPSLSIACYDQFNNNVLFERVPKLKINLMSKDVILGQANGIKADIRNANLTMVLKDILVKSNKLDKIRPDYEATLNISTLDEDLFVNFPCQVMPGFPAKITCHPRVIEQKLVPGQVVDELTLEVFDSFGNHVKKDEIMHLLVDGFSLQDGTTEVRKSGSYYTMKVDADGYVDLSNMLKVSKGYGADVTLCVVFEKKTIFQLNFQTEMRELRTLRKVYEHCEAGSYMENTVFEITNPEGVVDETITDDEKSGQLHSLKLTSDSFEIDASVHYSFRHGRCTIRTIPLPQTEGIFSFKASHSRYPELNLEIKVHVEKIYGENNDVGNHDPVPVTSGNLSPQSPVNRVPLADHECCTPQSSNIDIPPFDCTPLKVTPKREYNKGAVSGSLGRGNWTGLTRSPCTPQSSMRTIFPRGYSPSQSTPRPDHNVSPDVPDFYDLDDCSSDLLEDDLLKYGSRFLDRQRNIQMREHQKMELQMRISELQASMGHDYVSQTFERDSVRNHIENRRTSAAAVICQSLTLPNEERPRDILGVVALLGSTQSVELSRMLTKYIGEEQMLAVVCKNYSAVEGLQRDLNEFARKCGLSVSGGLNALCLEDVSPIITESRSYPTGPLPLRTPTLPDGSTPKGFLGFAINMITVDANHTDWRTKSGFGLREALFYPLLGELQVYEDRHCMKMARSCITGSAISLDGVIMRRNGLVSLGNWEPDIHFPVTNTKPLSRYSSRTWSQIEEKNQQLVILSGQLEEEYKLLQEDEEIFEQSRVKYNSSQKQILS